MSQHTFRKEISLVWVDPKKYWKINNKKISINEENYNNTDTITTRSNTWSKRKSTYASDDYFKQNGNIAHRMSRSVDHGLDFFLHILNAAFIDGLLIERCKIIVTFAFVLLAMFVFVCVVINY